MGRGRLRRAQRRRPGIAAGTGTRDCARRVGLAHGTRRQLDERQGLGAMRFARQALHDDSGHRAHVSPGQESGEGRKKVMPAGGSSQSGLELSSEFLVAKVRRAWPWHWKQGLRRPPLISGSDAPAVRLVTDFRIKGVSEDAARGVAAWSRGLDVAVFDRVPCPLEVLRLQALGGRCVSLLSADTPMAPHESALEFLLHDLCHIGKFADPRYYREQVGFFT